MTVKKIRIAGLLLLGGILLGGSMGVSARQSHEAALSRNLNTFNAIVKELDMNYVDSLKPEESLRKAINAMLSTIDPYTEYYDTEDQEQLQRMTTGEFGGIGSYIMQRDGKSYISAPME
ncbi:MAG: peptidase S41, partial [Muribaculaceae bacterium]|nr:peptidase S41 [Muribaculaceae bacterium]